MAEVHLLWEQGKKEIADNARLPDGETTADDLRNA
ncbi:hypothetical protein SEA_PUPPER_79 [Gordonia phage Pupper]|uniref:Uncharacterized protein n=1 Tax=Gordonia phage Pupper TaxID=2571249 RepID=A0A4Y6EKJ9_9CAUD|nr:hypothetical protein KHQ83_gp198 [Gordonia phage Pupper]QDF18565.1 hypothetical protein SEA_PUPPER_79 [Gordonia phage Pupper]